jgi:hypothetical protein
MFTRFEFILYYICQFSHKVAIFVKIHVNSTELSYFVSRKIQICKCYPPVSGLDGKHQNWSSFGGFPAELGEGSDVLIILDFFFLWNLIILD